MIRGILTFFVVWAIITIGIIAWRSFNKQERVDTRRAVVLGGITATLALTVLTIVVTLF